MSYILGWELGWWSALMPRKILPLTASVRWLAMRRWMQPGVLVCSLLVAAQAGASDTANTCSITRVTEANGIELPYLAGLWYGSAEFAVAIPQSGRWSGMGAESDYSGKLFLYADGFEPKQISRFTLLGTNLDYPDERPIQLRPTNAKFDGSDEWLVLVGLGFLKPGCWEMVAHYKDRTLAFTLWVG